MTMQRFVKLKQRLKHHRRLCVCHRCGWQWLTRATSRGRLPHVCSRCNSPYWNTPRTKPAPPHKKYKLEGES